MKPSVLLLIASIFISSCRNSGKQTFQCHYDTFIFSQSLMHSDYSIKFTHSDTIFIEQRFPRPKQLFYATVATDDLQKLDSFLNAIHFSNYDTTYIQNNLQDGISYKFNLTKDTSNKWIFVYGMEGPKTLYQFAEWITNLKDRQNLTLIDTSINFGDLKYILLPTVSAPPTK